MKFNTVQQTGELEFKNFNLEKIRLTKEKFKEKVEAMLIGGAIGDALGVPVEMRTKEQISKRYGRLDRYLPAKENLFFRKGGLESDESGLISDDTILTFSGVKSIVKSKGIDFDDTVLTSIEDYKNFPYGFGRGTREAFERYENGTPYTQTGDINSAGNGVIMKQSPYAVYSLSEELTSKAIDKNLETLTKITHPHPLSIVASLVHNKFLMELLKTDKKINIHLLLTDLYHYSIELENKFYSIDELKSMDKLSKLFSDLIDDSFDGGLSDDEILDKYGWGDKKVYASGYVLTTLGICYSLFIRKQNFDTLIDSINIGGDVDTFGAIIGNMIGAYKGKFYDDKYVEGLKKADGLKQDIDKFNDFLLDDNI